MSIYSAFRPRSEEDHSAEDDSILDSFGMNLNRINPFRSNGSSKTTAKDSHLNDDELEVRNASLEILPLIMSDPPSIPAAFKSTELNQRHFLLSISPQDVDAYLVTPTNNSDAPSRAISALHRLKGQIENISGTEVDVLEQVVQSIQWNSPEKNELLASVNLGSDRGLLSMVLKQESVPGGRAAWKFHNLLPFGQAPGLWQSSVDAALGVRKPTQLAAPPRMEEDHTGRSRASSANTFGGRYETADEGSDVPDDERPQDATTYNTAEDFWGGFDDESNGAANGELLSTQQTAEQDEADDEAYWASYEAQDPHGESQRREELAREQQRLLDLDSVSQMGSVNFEGVEGRMRDHAGSPPFAATPAEYFQRSTSMTTSASGSHHTPTQPPAPIAKEKHVQLRSPALAAASRDSPAQQTYPDFPGVQSSHERRQTRKASDPPVPLTRDTSTAPPSPRLDDNDLNASDGEEEYEVPTYEYETTVEGTHRSSDPAGNAVEKSGKGDENDRRHLSTNGPDPSNAALLGMGIGAENVSNEALDDAASHSGDEDQQQGGDYYPPPPMSVSGQTSYETPADMSLAELEAFHRTKDQQRLAEARERISRLHQKDRKHQSDPAGGRQSPTSSEDADDGDSEVESAMQEARSALGEVVPDYSGLPGLGPDEPSGPKNRSAPPAPKEPSLETIEDEDESKTGEEARKAQRLKIPLTRQVSMDTLRRLADEGHLNEEKPKPKKRPSDMSTASIKSKAGLKNFLQLAPSTVVTDWADLDVPDDSQSPAPEQPLDVTSKPEESKGEEADHKADAAEQPPSPPVETFQADFDDSISKPLEEEPEQGDDDKDGEGQHLDQQNEGQPEADQEGPSQPIEASIEALANEEEQAEADGQDQREEPQNEEEEDGDEAGDQNEDQDEFDRQHQQMLDLPSTPQGLPGPKTPGQQSDFDLEAFMYPLSNKGSHHLDSPGLSDSDPRTKDVFNMMVGQRGQRGGPLAGQSEVNTPSDSFLPGAASDASVMPLAGSISYRARTEASIGEEDESEETDAPKRRGLQRADLDVLNEEEVQNQGDDDNDVEIRSDVEQHSQEGFSEDEDEAAEQPSRPRPNQRKKAPPKRPSAQTMDSSEQVGVDSTNTELGLAEVEDASQSQGGGPSVAPGPQYRGAAAPPGSTSQYTANLRHQYLRAQRQQALQAQRERIMLQRQNRPSNLRQSAVTEGGLDEDNTPMPLARGANQRPPFPEKKPTTTSNNSRGRGRGQGRRQPQQRQPAEDEEADSQDEQDDEEEPQQQDGNDLGIDEDQQNADDQPDATLEGPPDGANNAMDENIPPPSHTPDMNDQNAIDVAQANPAPWTAPAVHLPSPAALMEEPTEEEVGPTDPPQPRSPGASVNGQEGDQEQQQEQQPNGFNGNGQDGDGSPPRLDGEGDEDGNQNADLQRSASIPRASDRPHPRAARSGVGSAAIGGGNHNKKQHPFQEARMHASQAAQKRRELLKTVQSRNVHARALLKSFLNILHDTESPVSEAEWLRLSREAFRECAKERADKIAEGSLEQQGGEDGVNGNGVTNSQQQDGDDDDDDDDDGDGDSQDEGEGEDQQEGDGDQEQQEPNVPQQSRPRVIQMNGADGYDN